MSVITDSDVSSTKTYTLLPHCGSLSTQAGVLGGGGVRTPRSVCPSHQKKVTTEMIARRYGNKTDEL